MKMREVKKWLAMLLAAAMVLVMVPASDLTALAGFLDGFAPHGNGWKFEQLTMTAEPSTIKVDESTTVTIQASGIATAPNAESQLATPADVKSAFAGLEISDVNVTGDGEAEVTGLTKNDMGAVLTVVGRKAGTVTLTLNGTEAHCQITIEEAKEPEIIDIAVEPKELTIDLSESNKKQITLTAKTDGPFTDEQGNAIVMKIEKCVDQAVNSDETVAGLSGRTSYTYDENAIEIAAEIDVEGYKAGQTTLTFTINGKTVSCTVTVTKPADEGPLVYEETRIQSVPWEVYNELREKNVASAVVNEIINSLQREITVSDPAIGDVLKAKYPDASTIQVIPTARITNLDADVVDGQVNVKSINADLRVEVKVDGEWQSGNLETVFGRKIAVPISVPVPAGKFRGGSNYVQWQHYTDEEMTNEDPSAIVDRVTPINEDNMATVEVYACSPFKLTFVASDNDPVIPSGSSGHSSAGSSTPSVSVGTWVLAADGVRWWYRNPDGTWPAGGWAQLVWNGRTDWYYFDAEGYMVTGWVTDGGLKYYLHPFSDGTQGYMYTGWHEINGKWYYFSDISDGTRGHLLVNTSTPDGYQVGADGSWIQ